MVKKLCYMNNQYKNQNGIFNNQVGIYLKYTMNKHLMQIDKKKVMETLFWVATIYLLYNNFNDIKDIASNSKNNKISTSTNTTKIYSNNFANRSIQQKYRILKYYGYFR